MDGSGDGDANDDASAIPTKKSKIRPNGDEKSPSPKPPRR